MKAVQVLEKNINLVKNQLSILGGLEAEAQITAPKSFFENEYVLKDPDGGTDMKIQLPVKDWKNQGYIKSKGKNYSVPQLLLRRYFLSPIQLRHECHFPLLTDLSTRCLPGYI